MYSKKTKQTKLKGILVFLNKALVKISKNLKTGYAFGMPYNVLIEPTNICNLKCPGCPTGAGILKREKGYMPFDNFKKIIDEIGWSLEKILLWNYGEPLLNKEVFKMIACAREKGIRVITSTNGYFLEGRLEKILNSGLNKIIISIDGASEETYNLYRKGGDFNKIIRNIKALCQKKKNLFVELQFIIMRHNEHEIPKIKKLAQELGVDKLTLKSVWFLDKRLQKMFKDLIPKNKKYQRVLGESGHCLKPWYHMVIQWNGDVSPCCYDADCNINLGNIFKTSVRKVWNGKKYQNLRKIMKRQFRGEKIISICNKCPELSERRITS